MNQLTLWFSNICILFMLLPLILSLINKKELNKNLYFFKYLLLGQLIMSLLERFYIYLGYNHIEYIMPFINWAGVEDTNFLRIGNYLVCTYFLGKFYYSLLKQDPIAPFIKWTALTGSVAMLINYFFIEGYKVVGYFNPNFDNFFCLFTSGYYLVYLLKSDNKVPISKNSYFWISLGLFTYCIISSIFRFIGDDLNRYNYNLYLQFLMAKNVIDLIAQILYGIGFYYAFYTRYLHQEEVTA